MGLTFILLPGMHGTGELFGDLLRIMPAEVQKRVVEYPRDRVMGYVALREFVEKEIEGQDEIVLISESFSGVVALEVAAKNPHKIKAVVLCAGFVLPPVPRLLCWMGAPLALLRLPIPRFAVRLFLAGNSSSGELVRNVLREVRSVDSRVMAHRVLSASRVNACSALRRCRAPVLCLAGTRDQLVGNRSWKRIRRVRPDVQVHLLDAPHLLLQVKAEEAWRLIETFCAQCASVPVSSRAKEKEGLL